MTTSTVTLSQMTTVIYALGLERSYSERKHSKLGGSYDRYNITQPALTPQSRSVLKFTIYSPSRPLRLYNTTTAVHLHHLSTGTTRASDARTRLHLQNSFRFGTPRKYTLYIIEI